MESSRPSLIVRHLPLVDYNDSYAAMRAFVDARTPDTPDEMWLLQHPPVFTLGQAGKPEHVLAAGDIPVIHCDRGGQVTYHGPGQLVAYFMLDMARLHLHTRSLVAGIVNATIEVLDKLGVASHGDKQAPGVYVGERKIASLGLRIRKGMTYHGLAFNHDMDMSPWHRIDPCGYKGLEMTSLAQEGVAVSAAQLEQLLTESIARTFHLKLEAGDVPAWYTQKQQRRSA